MATREQMISDCEQKYGFKPNLWCCARPEGHRGNCNMIPALSLTASRSAKCKQQEYAEYVEFGGITRPCFYMSEIQGIDKTLTKMESEDLNEFREDYRVSLVKRRAAIYQYHTAKYGAG